MTSPRLLILDNSVEPELYGPVHHWGRHAPGGMAVDSFRTRDGAMPRDVDAYTHAIVTGSEATINADDPWILQAIGCVRTLADAGVPILASCFGHQMVVRALSGKAHVRSSPTPEFGWIDLAWQAAERARDPIARALPSPAFVYASHFDEVCDLPAEWVTLASTPRCAHAVIRWSHGPIWGFQHHPEIEPPEGQALYDGFLERVDPARRPLMTSGFFPEVRDSYLTGTLVRAFLETGRGATPSP